ncbi:PEP-CTERM system histidine kinase PrsK [Rheinheimera riviphila]|uniref:histidine kinase n=1 Tax=Rheinheimera riviphila TaxID=1834037 RepID=A0A437QRY1_9GAMM|nr:XrtA/PEP-CTERM system histidine kinase PrsK [Rheinheimera riviphila]RVU37260.1 PEP-CTERM system histidine kinase PrsK [Rheinheimera riviphila]
MFENFQPGHFGFALAALGYALFWTLQLTVKTQTAHKHLLSTYTILSVLWAFDNFRGNELPFVELNSFLIESTHKMLLALFLLAALNRTDVTIRQLFATTKIKIVCLIFASWLVFGGWIYADLGARLMGTLLLTVVMLALIEAIYRQSGSQKWQFKPMIIALGICLLLDFYLLAEAALLGKVNQQTWQARGFVHVMMLPFLVVAVKRIKSWGINVYVSRDIVLQSSLVLAAGVYLCLLAIVGYYLSYIGGNWTTLLQVVFVVVGTALFCTLVFSDAIRRKYKVFIEKHFFANTFDYREKWVELTRELKKVEIANQNAPAVCLTAWCKAIGYSDGALVKLTMTEAPEVLATTPNYQLSTVDLQIAAIYQQKFGNKNWLLDFSDLNDHDVKAIHQELNGLTETFALLVPFYQNNQLWGCCLLKPLATEHLKLNWELRDYLNAVSEQISSYLFMSEASKELSENAQFMAFSRMSAFVVHDLKNVKAQIDMLLKNAKRHRHNPEFVDDAFETIEAMQSRLQNMLSQLTQKQTGSEHKKTVVMARLLQQLITERCAEHEPLPQLQVIQDCELYIDHERLCNILFHLIDNAQQATAADGSVTVELAVQNETMILKIIDTGCGMSAEFIKERLFKPFDTTKGNAGMGIGAYDAQNFIQQNQGQLSVFSEVNIGSTFTIQLPLH